MNLCRLDDFLRKCLLITVGDIGNDVAPGNIAYMICIGHVASRIPAAETDSL